MQTISYVHAREILDSRGNPTLEVEVRSGKAMARAMVPSGASTGTHEALELRDKGSRYRGKGVLKAVENVNTVLSEAVKGLDPLDQKGVDTALIEADGTPDKTNLGANALLGVSLAVCRLASIIKEVPLYSHISDIAGNSGVALPVPQSNVINGGKHAGREHDIQEHMVAPLNAASFSEAIRMVSEVYHELRGMLKKKYGASAVLVGDEGGFVPPEASVHKRLDLLSKAVENCGYQKELSFALDPAASEFFEEGFYVLEGKKYSSPELVDFYSELSSAYPIYSIEDGLAEDDWSGFEEMTRKLGTKMQVVGDDLLCTNPERIRKAVSSSACNALLLKVNQIGTLTEALEAFSIASSAGWRTVVSHRSGETEDSFIADLVVGIGAGQSKFGAPARSERTSKYNQLLRIEEELGENAVYGFNRG